MRWQTLIKTAFFSLRANLGRSALTILGIVIGILAIVLVVSLGQGARQLILSEIQSIGGNTIVLRPGRQPEGPSDIADTILADSVKDRDIRALLRPENVPGLERVDPAILVSGSMTYQDAIYRPITFGWTADAMLDFFQISPSSGRYFTADELKQRARVVVLGHRVKQELFGDSDALGEFVKIRDLKLRVIGIISQRGQVAIFNVDEIALIHFPNLGPGIRLISLKRADDGEYPAAAVRPGIYHLVVSKHFDLDHRLIAYSRRRRCPGIGAPCGIIRTPRNGYPLYTGID